MKNFIENDIILRILLIIIALLLENDIILRILLIIIALLLGIFLIM